MSFQTPITIKEAIENIENNKYLLPAIQREFVWKHTKIEWLFDSIMRNYPISSFLFWQVSGDTKNSYKFYKFISEFRETFKIHNEEISTDGESDFQAILDGQQRLTSIYIGLKGSYAYREPQALKAENSERTRPTRHLYLNISNELKDEEDGRVYEFKFLKKDDTKEKDVYIDNKNVQWFKVGSILNYKNEEKFDDFVESMNSSFARKAIRQLRRSILEKEIINYFLEKESDLDKALNIFIRINSGGEPLNFSDLIMSIAVANWTTDARKEIHTLVDNIRDKGFSISKDFVLKVFLYLHSRDIKFKVTNFSTDNAIEFEKNWKSIREAILAVFDLIVSYGFTDYSLTSKNALIPIVYYVYYRKIYKDFSTKISYSQDRDEIKKWLHIMLIKRIFGSSSDTILTQVRYAFTDDFETIKIDNTYLSFPSVKISSEIKKNTGINEDFIDDLLSTQKDDKYAFSILSLLYPNLDYKNNNFHKDHLHPISKFTKNDIDSLQVSDQAKEKYYKNKTFNNGLYNLQMLDANENMSKNASDLKAWIDKETTHQDKKQFLDNHLIPDVDFSFDNFEEFVEKRKTILVDKLRTILA
jgi:uncharacterized protein with ParB-like and HNH nuclease domain